MKPILLVPMAGKGQRFLDEGYQVPKQFIDVGGKSMLEWSFRSFNWEDCEVVFVVRKEQVDKWQVDTKLQSIFGNDIKIVVSDGDTEGTVCSCLLAKNYINKDVPLGITTLDVYFRPHFDMKSIEASTLDGLLLTIETDNPAYSYSKLGHDGLVEKTAEKEVISNHGNVGFYCFSKGSDFVKYAEKLVAKNIRSKNEFYVAPLYNLLIEDGLKIGTLSIDDQFHMGTPAELEYFLSNDLERIRDEVW
tara:strand:- start:5056 stop:5796 length:741 start_codon:yes stop_codon:yes gene_type:complete